MLQTINSFCGCFTVQGVATLPRGDGRCFLTCTFTTVPSRSLYQAVLHLLPDPFRVGCYCSCIIPLLMLRSLHPTEVVGITTKKAAWMKSNRLCLNPSKTRFMRCASSSWSSRRHGHSHGHGHGQLSTAPIEFCSVQIQPETSVRNLGVIIDSAMSFQPHISSVIGSCFYQLRRMKSSLKLFPFDTASGLAI